MLLFAPCRCPRPKTTGSMTSPPACSMTHAAPRYATGVYVIIYIYTYVYLHALSVKMYKTHLQRTSAYNIIWCTILQKLYICIYIYSYIQYIHSILQYISMHITSIKPCHTLGKPYVTISCNCGPLTSPQQTWHLELRRGHCPEGDPKWGQQQTTGGPWPQGHMVWRSDSISAVWTCHVKYMEIPI